MIAVTTMEFILWLLIHCSNLCRNFWRFMAFSFINSQPSIMLSKKEDVSVWSVNFGMIMFSPPQLFFCMYIRMSCILCFPWWHWISFKSDSKEQAWNILPTFLVHKHFFKFALIHLLSFLCIFYLPAESGIYVGGRLKDKIGNKKLI